MLVDAASKALLLGSGTVPEVGLLFSLVNVEINGEKRIMKT